MFSIYVAFKCFPGKREAFVKRVKEEGILDAIRAEDGCLVYDYYYSEKDENELLLIEKWETKHHQEILELSFFHPLNKLKYCQSVITQYVMPL